MAAKKLTKQSKKPAVAARRKRDDERKVDVIRIRVTEEQKRVLTLAASKAGLDASGWLRALGLERAQEMGVA